MPLSNSSDVTWDGYLVEKMGTMSGPFLRNLQSELASRSLPKVEMKPATVNMWWRKESSCLDITSTIDGSVQFTVHAMEYGTSLFIGVAYMAISGLGNYYKRMAASAFLQTVDRCIGDAIRATAENAHLETPTLTQIGKSGKFGG